MTSEFFKIVEGERVDLTAAEIEEVLRRRADTSYDAELARRERNQLLAVSDWTQVSDSPVDKQAWATYRQALRDVPAQQGFPDAIDWPVPPT
jgi:hypothetical protein